MAITDPRDIPGLVAWYSADYEAASLSDGASVSTWHDLSGNGNHAVGSPGPVLRTGVGASGGPGVSFENATGQFYSLPANLMSGATAGEVMVTAKAAPGTWAPWALGSPANESLYLYSIDGQIYEQFGLQDGGRQSFSPTMSVTTWRRYNVWSAPGDWSALLDGTVLKTYSGGTVTWDSAPLLGRGRYLGNPDILFGGYMGVFLLYGRKLTTTERSDLTTWVTANQSGGTPAAPTPTGTLSGVLPALTANLSGGIEFSGTISATLPPLGANLSGTSAPAGVAGTLSAELPSLGSSLVGAYSDTATLAAVLPPLSANLAGTYAPPPVTGTLSATLPSLAANLAGTAYEPGMTGTLNALLPALTVSLSGDVLGRTGLGLALDSSAVLTVEAALEPEPTVPPGTPSTVLHIIAPTVPVPTLVAGRPQ